MAWETEATPEHPRYEHRELLYNSETRRVQVCEKRTSLYRPHTCYIRVSGQVMCVHGIQFLQRIGAKYC